MPGLFRSSIQAWDLQAKKANMGWSLIIGATPSKNHFDIDMYPVFYSAAHNILCMHTYIYICIYIYIIICIQYLICIRSNCSFSVAKIEFPSTGYPIAGWCIRENPTKMGIWHDSIKAALGNMMECRLLWNMAGCYLKNIWNIESPLSLIPNINGFHLKRWFSMTQVLEGDLKRSLWRNMTYGR